MRTASRHIVLALPLLACAALCTFARPAGGEPDAPRHVAAQTVYLHEAIEGFHKITIEGDLGGNGTLSLDPNSCTVNPFGDIEACTLLPPSTRSVTLSKAATPDPAGRGRVLYSIDGARLAKPLVLVVSPDKAQPPRLVYGERGPGTPRSITLELLLSSIQPPPRAAAGEPCTARYAAQQVPGFVVIFANGVHPTAGFEVRFEQSAAAVFPPQFTLLHVKPTGMVAQVISPFSVMTSFPAGQKIDRVEVRDANGSHDVPVEQVPDVK